MVDPILCVVGTRPEVIKMAPVIHRLREGKEGFDVQIPATGQHRSLLDHLPAAPAIGLIDAGRAGIGRTEIDLRMGD